KEHRMPEHRSRQWREFYGGRPMKSYKAIAVWLLCLIGLTLPALAQSDRATINGTVKDASTAVVPGVEVRVTNLATNTVWSATTNTIGWFQLSDLPIGNYKVQFSKTGFKTLQRNGVTLLI